MVRASLAAVLMATFLAGVAGAATFEVSPFADSDCGDLVCGFQSALYNAIDNGQDDTINLAPGAYVGGFGYPPDTAENYSLTITGAGAGKTVLDGQDIAQVLRIETSGITDTAASITIRGLTLIGGSATDGGGLSITTDAASVTIEQCEFLGGGARVRVISTSGPILIRGTHFIGVDGINADFWTIYGSIVLADSNCSGMGAFSAVSDHGSVLVSNSIFSQNVREGIYTRTLDGEIRVVNNTSVGNGRNGAQVDLFAPGARAYVSNNLLHANSRDVLVYDHEQTTAELRNNIFTTKYYWGAGTVEELGNLECVDPLLTPDHRLTAASPAIDAGANDAPGLPLMDFEGDPRIFDGDDDGTATVDIGADEYVTFIPAAADVTANGSDGPLTLGAGQLLTLHVSLDAWDMADMEADWWLLGFSGDGLYHATLGGPWQPGLAPTYQAPLFDIEGYPAATIPGLSPGLYVFYFGVDTNRNASLDMDLFIYDIVEVYVP